jgi:RHS repeat-associated protein
LESYTYDVYGTPTFYNASGTQISGTANGISMLYTGQRWHTEIEFYDNRNRFYHPGLGRFLQPDPIGFAGDPVNLYRYVANNPVNWSDPFG